MGTLTRNRLIRVLSICRNILENSKTWVENKYRWFKTVDFSKTKEFLTERIVSSCLVLMLKMNLILKCVTIEYESDAVGL